MSKKLSYFTSVLALLLCLGANAFGQEQFGQIEGTVNDPTGAVVPGVSVTATTRANSETNGGQFTVGYSRTVTSDENGFFRFQQVPPGFYTLTTTEAAGFGTATVNNVEVVLGRATTIEVAVGASGGTNTVNVNDSDATAIDVNASEIQTNITARTAELLPKGVQFTSLLNIIPAVRNEPLSGGFQIDGASGSENTFIIDGQEVTNFRTGTLSANNNIPFQFVQEIQVKSSGFDAEFGGATGGVVTVVTKGGGNEFRGEAGIEFRPAQFQGNPRPFQNLTTFATGRVVENIPVRKDEGTDRFPSLTLGGPIIKNRAWFFGSYAPQYLNIDRTIDLFGADRNPATRTIASTNTYTQRRKNEYAFGRIDLQPIDSIRLTGTYLWNPIEIIGQPPGNSPFGTIPQIIFPDRGAVRGPDLTNFQGGRQSSNNTTGTVVFTPTSNLVLTARGGYSFLNEKVGNYGVPAVAGQTRYITQVTGTDAPASFGQASGTQNFPSFTQLLFDVSRRRTFDGDASYLLSDFGGRHQFKGGVQFNGISNAIQSTLVDTVVFRFGANQTVRSRSGRSDAPAPTPGALGAGFLQRFATQGSAGSDNLAFYIQDEWQPFSRLTLNIGVRTERENSPSFNDLGDGIKFSFSDKIAPRLGFALDPFGDGRTKIFGSYGQFYDRFKYELPRGSFGGDFFRNDYFEILPGQTAANFTRQTIIGSNPDPIGGNCPITVAGVLSRCQLDFRIPSNLPGQPEFGQVDPDIEAFKQSEYTVGVERSIGSDFLLRARYTHKQVDVAVEDIGIPVPGGEAYVIGNPGRGLAREIAEASGFLPLEAARDYDAFEVSLDKRFVNNFYFNTSYTLSRLFGNYAGLASSDEPTAIAINGGGGTGRTAPNVNRNFDLPFIGFSGLGQPDNGRLPTDRPHVFKFSGAYEIKYSSSNSTEISGFTTVQSGTPVTTRYELFGVVGQILNGRGDLGRTAAFTQTDLGIRHRYRFGNDNRFAIVANLDVLNLFDESNELARFETLGTTGVTAADIGITQATSLEQEAQYQRQAYNVAANAFLQRVNPATGQNSIDPRYNLPNLFQGARSVRFGFRFQF